VRPIRAASWAASTTCSGVGKKGLPHLEVDGFGVSPGQLHDLAYARDGHGTGDRRGRRGPVSGSGSALARSQWTSSSACLPYSPGRVVDQSVAAGNLACLVPAVLSALRETRDAVSGYLPLSSSREPEDSGEKGRQLRAPGCLWPDDSSKPKAPIQVLPGDVLALQAARPRDAPPVPRRLRREQPRVRPDPHPPQVQPVGVPAHPDGRV
jgi:hypothetical protein